MLSIGMNRKLGKKVAVFNLPARKTCPGMTAYCGPICYAMKAERMYKQCKASRARNYKASLRPDFAIKMGKELDTFKGEYARIHEAGDYYNQRYLNKWLKIARSYPELTFLSYTKMYDRLDFSKKTSNFLVYSSLDPTSLHKLNTVKRIFKRCVIVDKAEDVRAKGWHVCPPVTKDHHNYCGVDCKVCWKGQDKVVWIKH